MKAFDEGVKMTHVLLGGQRCTICSNSIFYGASRRRPLSNKYAKMDVPLNVCNSFNTPGDHNELTGVAPGIS